jgi:hypothetical protein
MPFKSEKAQLINTEFDRRVKLTAEQKEDIKYMHNELGYSGRQLAREFGVSKSRIQQIYNPEREKKVRQQRKEFAYRYKQTKEDRAETMRNHRRYKEKLFKEGKIKINKEL